MDIRAYDASNEVLLRRCHPLSHGKWYTAFNLYHKHTEFTNTSQHPKTLTLEGSLKRSLSLRGQSGNVASLTILPIEHGRVTGHAVIPDDDSASLPANAGLQVLRQGDVVVQELQEEVRFFFLVSDDVAGDYQLVSVRRFAIWRAANSHCGFT